jgi:hypothetical protein
MLVLLSRRNTAMTPERTKEFRTMYHREMEAVEETVTMALCETYKSVTGKPASDRLRDAIADAIRFNC